MLTRKHIGQGADRDGAALLYRQGSKTMFCRKCGQEKPFFGGHTKKPKGNCGVNVFVCADCSPPKPPYVPPPPKAQKKAGVERTDARGVMDPERIRLIGLVRGDREILRLALRQIQEKRGLTKHQVAGIIYYRSAPHIDPCVEAA